MTSKKTSSESRNVDREIDELKSGLTQLHIEFDAHMIERFEQYLNMLYSYHGRLHLLSHGDYERISRRHFLPSLAAFPYVRDHGRVCDVGAGAGFPSIPLKIVLPKFELVIFESKRKKAEFLRSLINALCLERIEVRNERAEDFSGAGFDLLLLRAVGKIADLTRVIDKLLVAGGEALFFKSQSIDDELRRAESIMKKKGFTAKVTNLSTPLERMPLALVSLSKLS
ncbi:MAG: 16S rRNA (guanine(527)-N(7))-methyltransferase RsmG [candidate division WOR-3 bacterium]|nr:MAG: 16S rRNA (guanine(527)-N(7))-methyltransferase RsmG [candidate division WOR-3 bacterium]